MSKYNPFTEHNLNLHTETSLSIGSLIERFYDKELKPKIQRDYFEGNNKNKPCFMDIIALNQNPTANGGNIQRGLVWGNWQKLELLQSIYNGRRIGAILLAKRIEENATIDILYHKGLYEPLARATKENPFVVYENLLIDGKQRLNTIKCFVGNEFSDHNGMYFNDLSENAKGKFMDFNKFEVVTLNFVNENDIIDFFALSSYAGKPQEKEHIEYVLSLKK